MQRAPVALLLAAVASGLLLGCVDPPEQPASTPVRQLVVSSLIDHVYLPMLRQLHVSAAALEVRAGELCAGPDAARLEAARAAWLVVRSAYKQTSVMAFGPHSYAPFRSASQLDFWPVRPDSIEAVLSGEQDLSDPDTALSAAARGLPAIEYVLFAPGHDADWFEEASRRCEYLEFIGRQLREDAEVLLAAWVDTFADELRAADGTDRYEDVDEAFTAIVNELGFVVQIIRDEKLARPLGLKNGGVPQLDKRESPFAERAVDDMRDDLRGVAAVFYGEYGEQAGPGLARALGDTGADIGAFELQWQRAMGGLDGMGGGLGQVIETEPERVESALAALRELLVYLQVDMAQALNVTTTFGGADGD